MDNKTDANLIPAQETGAANDTVASAAFATSDDAKAFYEIASNRLRQVNRWQEWARGASARFQLADVDGNDVDRTVQRGDHFKIDIPGPGPVTGNGFDWVQVEQVEMSKSDDTDQTTIQVRPATNPKNNRSDVAHFFSGEASSSFIVKRTDKTVSAEVHGRNEKPNISAESLIDKARNAAVATGAVAAFAKLQWIGLVNGLISTDNL